MNVDYLFKAKPDPSKYPFGVYDGDTIDVFIDVGFGVTVSHRIRLIGIDTPELRGIERDEGIRVRDIVRHWIQIRQCEADDLRQTWCLFVRTSKSDSFGRYLGEVFDRDGLSLNDYLLESGHARPYRR